MVHIILTMREQKLLDALAAIPPNMDKAEQYLKAEQLECDEVTRVAIEYAYQCFCEVGDYAHDQRIPHPSEIVPNLHSSYIFDVVNLLLQYGMDPNGVHEDCNIMDSLRFVDNEFLAADTLALLLEHGGKTDLTIPGEFESLFAETDFDVFFDAFVQSNRQRYASLVHYWMVLIGYGAQYDEDMMEAFRNLDSSEPFVLEKLKNHRNYFFGVTHLEKGIAISIYDKDTLWEVVRFKWHSVHCVTW